jgi:hypothetical protein
MGRRTGLRILKDGFFTYRALACFFRFVPANQNQNGVRFVAVFSILSGPSGCLLLQFCYSAILPNSLPSPGIPLIWRRCAAGWVEGVM